MYAAEILNATTTATNTRTTITPTIMNTVVVVTPLEAVDELTTGDWVALVGLTVG